MGIPALLLSALGAAATDGGDVAADADAARVDALIRTWSDAPSSADDLAEDLERLGAAARSRMAGILDGGSAGSTVNLAIATALGRSGDPACVGLLHRLGSTTGCESRPAALTGLAQSRGLAEVPVLIAALDDESDDIADIACDALQTWIDRNPDLAWKASIDRPLGDCRRRFAAARVLGRLDSPAAHAALRRMLSSPSPIFQAAALDGLADGGEVDDRDAVRSLLRPSADMTVRKRACIVVAALEDAESIPDLIDALGEDDAGLVSNARWALQKITGEQLAADPDLWMEWWIGAGRSTLAKLTAPRVPAVVERRGIRNLEGFLRAGVDADVACSRVAERFGVDDATAAAWLERAQAQIDRDRELAALRRGASSSGSSGDSSFDDGAAPSRAIAARAPVARAKFIPANAGTDSPFASFALLASCGAAAVVLAKKVRRTGRLRTLRRRRRIERLAEAPAENNIFMLLTRPSRSSVRVKSK